MYWDYATASPITDIRHAKTQARLNSGGFVPNIGVFSRPVFDKLVDHPDFIDRTKYGQTAPNPAMATRRIIAEILELEEVLVMDAVYNTAAEGATESNSFIGGTSAALFYRPRNPGLMTPSAGYTFNWTGLIGSTGGAGLRIKTLPHGASGLGPRRDRRGIRHARGLEGLRLLLQQRHLGGVTMFLRKLSWAQLTTSGVPPLFVLRPLPGGFTPPEVGAEYPAPDPVDKFQMTRARQMYEQRRIGTRLELEVALAKSGRRAGEARETGESQEGEREWSKLRRSRSTRRSSRATARTRS